ncbi:hypothetical protein RND81_08G057000 [Saponaria officinalis]|uniref:Uncharacterized protein n=1 Tax=Saponaria officinalis TaxID=3572 RepID=A0AAW1J569_SAPOF
MEDVVLKMHYKLHFVEVLIEDTDKTLIMDVYNDMLDAVEEENILGWPENPYLAYSFNSKLVQLRDDNDLMEMFRRLEGKTEIDIRVGSDAKPCHALLMAREVRSYAEKDDVDAVEGKPRAKLPIRTPALKPVPKPSPKLVPKPAPKPIPEPAPKPVTEPAPKPVPEPAREGGIVSPRRSARVNANQAPKHTSTDLGYVAPDEPTLPAQLRTSFAGNAVISPRTSVKVNSNPKTPTKEKDTSQAPERTSPAVVSTEPNQPVQLATPSKETAVISPRRSGRLNTRQGGQPTSPAVEHIEHTPRIDTSVATSTRRTSQTCQPRPADEASKATVPKFKIPRTTALRKGVYVRKDQTVSVEIEESNSRARRGCRSRGSTTEVTCGDESEDSDGSYVASVEDEIDEEEGLTDLEREYNAVIFSLQFVDDDYNP